MPTGERGEQEAVIGELIVFNWPRTASITGSALLALPVLLSAFSPA